MIYFVPKMMVFIWIGLCAFVALGSLVWAFAPLRSVLQKTGAWFLAWPELFPWLFLPSGALYFLLPWLPASDVHPLSPFFALPFFLLWFLLSHLLSHSMRNGGAPSWRHRSIALLTLPALGLMGGGA